MADRTVTVKLVIDTSEAAPSLAQIGRGFGRGGSGGGRRGFGGGAGGGGPNNGGGGGAGGTGPNGGDENDRSWWRYQARQDRKAFAEWERKTRREEQDEIKAEKTRMRYEARQDRKAFSDWEKRVKKEQQDEAKAERTRIRQESYLDRQAMTLYEKQMAKEEAQIAKRDAARHGLGIQALGFAGMGGIAGHYGQMQLLGQHLGTLGEAAGGWGGSAMVGAGAMISRAALPAAIAVEAERLYREHTKLAQNPYLSDTQRQIRFAEKLPFGSTVMDMTRTYSGYDAALALTQNEINPMLMFAKEREIEMRNIGRNHALEVRRAQMAAAEMRDYGAVALPTGDRFTAFGKREYAETSRLQGPTQQLELAQRQLTIAMRNRSITEEELFKTEKELVKAEKVRANAEWRTRLDGSDPELAAREGDFNRAKADYDDLKQHKKNLLEKSINGAKEIDAAKHQVDLARIQLGRARQENLESRAEQTASHYMNLAMMGPGGRAIAANAYQIIKQTGVINADPTVLAQAMSWAPNDVRARIERELSGADFIRQNRDVDPAFGDLREQREAADAQRRQNIEAEAESTAAVTERQAKTLSGAIAKSVDELLQIVIKDYTEKVEALKVGLRANQNPKR